MRIETELVSELTAVADFGGETMDFFHLQGPIGLKERGVSGSLLL